MRPQLAALMLAACLITVPGLAQTSGQRRLPVAGAPQDEDEARERIEHDMAKKAIQERNAALKTDTDKLLKLAVELKNYVDKSNEHVLSLDVVKKADEIEKLAHSVKEKMKGPN